MTRGLHRPKSDRRAEEAFVKLVNTQAERGFIVTRLPGAAGGAWIVNIGGGVDQIDYTLEQAVEKAIRKAAK
jgi:UDP-N-acetylenolpyruvoylglucosamine reductase